MADPYIQRQRNYYKLRLGRDSYEAVDTALFTHVDDPGRPIASSRDHHPYWCVQLAFVGNARALMSTFAFRDLYDLDIRMHIFAFFNLTEGW